MKAWLGTLAQAHGLNWAYDDRYRWAWYVWPQAASIVIAAWLLAGAPTYFPTGTWGKPENQLAGQIDQLRNAAKTDTSARERLKRLAEGGEHFAQFSYGTLFDPVFKHSETQDINTALEWYKKGADQGNLAALAAYGQRYYFGQAGLKVDYDKALPYLTAAANLGHAECQRLVGSSYLLGHGTKVDKAEAAKWFRASADNGDRLAQAFLGDAYANGTGVEKSIGEAVNWYRKSAEGKNWYGQRQLGILYYDGTGVPKDYATAFQLFKESAEQNDSIAQYYLGDMYEQGTLVKRDAVAAVSWYRKSADQGYGPAQNNLGGAYMNGEGVEKDLAAARSWFEKAKANGVEKAAANLRELGEAAAAEQSSARNASTAAWRSCVNAEQPTTAISLCFPLTNDRSLSKSNMAAVFAKLAWACLQVDDYTLAIDWAHKAVQLQKIPSQHYIAGQAYIALKDADHAIDELDAAINLAPKYVLAIQKRGEAYLMLGDIGRARSDFELALSIDPKFKAARESLTRLNKK